VIKRPIATNTSIGHDARFELRVNGSWLVISCGSNAGIVMVAMRR